MKYIEPIDLFENLALAKKLIRDKQTLDQIIAIDPSPTKKYTGWIE